MKTHNCDLCRATRKILVEKVDNDDIDVFSLIQNGIRTAQRANNPNAVPDGTNKDKAESFFAAAIDKEAHYHALETQWWRNMIEKYNISENTRIDIFHRQFYMCIDNDGNNVSEFIEK